jgi:hypothetical protein
VKSIEELAQDAYTSYGAVTGGLNHTGGQMPPWEELGEQIQEAWKTAAGTVRDHAAAAASTPIYRERAHLVALLSTIFPAELSHSDPSAPDWPVLHLTTPAGQATWHISPEDVDLFGHLDLLPAGAASVAWDGHTTEEKYERLYELVRLRAGANWVQHSTAQSASG